MKTLLKLKKISETPFRLEVLKILESSKSAVTMPFIESNLKSYNRITLYRTIKTFVEKGIIHPISMSDGEMSYGLCQDTCEDTNHTHEHIHLKCKVCNAVFCVEVDSFPTINIGNHQIDSLEIQATGTCQGCLGMN